MSVLQAFDPITQQLLQSLINIVNRSSGVVDGAKLPVSSQFAGSYVYASPSARSLCHKALNPLTEQGLIDCGWHLQVLEDFETLKHIVVPKGRQFLEYLCIEPQVKMVANASSTLGDLRCGVDWVDQKIKEIGERWRLGARYLSLGPEHIPQVSIAAKVAQSIASEALRGRDIKALSLDWFGSSHTIDDHQQVIALFCESQINAHARDLDYNDQLASLGLVHHSPLLHLRGPFEAICDDDKLIDTGGWSGVALCTEFVRGFERNRLPSYVLTIENFTLYQRYLAGVQDDGLVIYIGDFPSARLLSFYEKIVDMLPHETPLLHWGDIDLAGFRSLLALQDMLFGREVRPYQMGVEQMLANAQPGPPIPMQKLRRMAFNCKSELRDLLVALTGLSSDKIRECSSEAAPVAAPRLAEAVL